LNWWWTMFRSTCRSGKQQQPSNKPRTAPRQPSWWESMT
jgi:hypothetical protein